jgi:hypothetical protein
MKESFRWKCMAAATIFLTIIFCGQASSQNNETYNNAVRMHGQYKQNQDQINALRQRIRDNEGAIRSLGRDMVEVAYGTAAHEVGRQYGPDIAAYREAIARDQQALALLERRQAIIEHSWNNNQSLKTYYGSLGETSRRTIYDPKTKKNVNLMDFRIDSFRNPGGKPTPPGVRSTSGSRSSSGRVGSEPSNKTTQVHNKAKNTPSTKKSSSANKSGGTGGGTHSISLVPVD